MLVVCEFGVESVSTYFWVDVMGSVVLFILLCCIVSWTCIVVSVIVVVCSL